MTELIVIAICLMVNALLSAFETAFVTINKPELKLLVRGGKKEAGHLLKLRENPERTLSVIQIGITLVGAISAAVGGAGAEESLAPILQARFNFSEDVAELISIGIVVLPLTYFSVVIGELVPKSLALKHPMKISLLGLNAVIMSERILGPLVKFLESSTKVFLKIFVRGSIPAEQIANDSESINLSSLKVSHKQYIVNLFHIEIRKIKDIMLPWESVNFIRSESTLAEVFQTIISSGHTRLPVMKGSSIQGLLNSKEFLSFVTTGDESWQQVVRSPIVIGPDDRLLDTLKLMQEQKKHMAIVMEGEETTGIVTLEDIVEEFLGEINDEDDDGAVLRLIASKSKLKNK